MTAKDKLNLYLIEKGLSNPTSTELPNLSQCQEVLQTFLTETLNQRSTSLKQLEQYHEQVSEALKKAPEVDQQVLTMFTSEFHSFLTNTANKTTTYPIPSFSNLKESNLQAIAKLKHLCLLKDRLHQASRALQDALRWSSLSSHITTWIELEDWHAAAHLLVQTTEDMNVFQPFLPPFELQRRVHILDDLYHVFLKAVAPKLVVQLQTRQSSALPMLKSLQRLTPYCKMNVYQQVRISELESYLSSLENSTSTLEAFGDWLERESTWLAQAFEDDRRFSLLFELIQAILPSTLPADPELCLVFLHRMERLFHIDKDAFPFITSSTSTSTSTSSSSTPLTHPILFLKSFQPLFMTLADAPSLNLSKYQKRFRELCPSSSSSSFTSRSTSPTRSPYEELHEWRTHLPSILMLFEQYWNNHVSICGPYFRSHLQSGITTLWLQLLQKHVDFLPPQPQPQPQPKQQHPPSLSSAVSSMTLDQHSFEPYQLILEYASQQLLPTSYHLQSLWNSPHSDLSTLPFSLRHYFHLNDSNSTPSVISPPHWPQCTLDWMYQRLDQFLKVLLHPILKHLPKELIQPTPLPTFTSPHFLSVKLAPFSLSPSPPITFVGDYLLQLPHYLDFQYPFPHPYVFGPTLSCLPTLLSPTAGSSSSLSDSFHGNDLIVTLGLIIQMEVLRGFYQFKPKLECMDQIHMDVNYLTNILNALECPMCLEWQWLLDMISFSQTKKEKEKEEDKKRWIPFPSTTDGPSSHVQHPSSFIMQFYDGVSKKQSYSVWIKQFQQVIQKMVIKKK